MSVLPAQPGQASAVKKGKKERVRGIISQNLFPKENPSPCPNFSCSLPVCFSSAEEHQQVLQIVLPNRIKVNVVTGIRIPIPYDHVNCPAALKSSV